MSLKVKMRGDIKIIDYIIFLSIFPDLNLDFSVLNLFC